MTSAHLIISFTAVLGLAIVAVTTLKGWRDWLALKTRELDRMPRGSEPRITDGASRIELADLRERIRKLEAIAAGVDL